MRLRRAVLLALGGAAILGVTAGLGVLPGLLLWAVLLALWLVFDRKDAVPWQEAAAVLHAVADGDHRRRLYVGEESEERLVNEALDRLVARLESLEGNRERLLALLDQLDDAILLLDGQNRVVLSNQAARALGGTEREVRGLPLLAVVPRSDLVRLVEAARASGAAAEEGLRHEGKAYAVRALPLPVTGEVLLRLRDRTDEERLHRMRQDFVANVSHELRTPLALVSGYAETLAGEELPPEEVRRFAAIVQRETSRLSRLVDDLLALSRAEAGEQVTLAPTRLRPVLERVVARFQPVADEDGVLLRIEGDEDHSVLAQAERVDQIVANLLDNAIRYSPPGGVVTLGLRPRGGEVGVFVRDQGEGIPEEEVARIFERFYRVDKSHRRRAQGGAGLGLAIARHLAEAMQGRIEVESRPGHGATFTLVLKAVDEEGTEP